MGRRWVLQVLSVAAIATSGVVAGSPGGVAGAAPPRTEALVPGGFADTAVANLGGVTTLQGLPDGTVVALTQGGSVRLISGGVLQPNPALVLPASQVCTTSEQGLLGMAVSGQFAVDHQIWLYYTGRNASVASGCVNRVSRFTMLDGVIDRSSEVILVDDIGAIRGNHNGGDLEIGGDGYLYIAIGDGGGNARNSSQVAGANPAAQDLSLLNGKILRVDRMTGGAAPGNPLLADPTSVDCRLRGNTPATPTTPCRELFAWGLRNPFRFAFDTNVGGRTFFINDVGQGAREEVDLGAAGANYGWPAREGFCAQGGSTPCGTTPPAPGLIDPLTDYPRTEGQFITGGAFVPNGFWPARFDGGYLFGDGGSGDIWLRDAAGAVDYAAPFATGAAGLTDMTFVQENGGIALYYAAGSSIRKITTAMPVATSSGPLTFRAVPQGFRAFDSRSSTEASVAPVRAGTTRYVKLPVDGAVTRAVLANVTFVDPVSSGYLIAWPGRTARPNVSNVNGVPGDRVANASVIPLDGAGGFLLSSYSTADVVVDVLGYFDSASNPSSAGRFAPLAPTRIADTREAVGGGNSYSRPLSAGLPLVRVPVAGRGGIPASGVGSVALIVTALGGSGPGGGYVLATASGVGDTLNSNLNTRDAQDIRANLVVVPVGPDGAVDLHLYNIGNVVVDVAGWFTDGSAAAANTGKFVSTPLQRMVDTRIGLGFGRMLALRTQSVTPPTSVPANALALAQNVTLVDTSGPGWVTPYPGGSAVPLVSAGNASGVGQIRAVTSLTKLSAAPATMSFTTYMDTELVVDVAGWFMP